MSVARVDILVSLFEHYRAFENIGRLSMIPHIHSPEVVSSADGRGSLLFRGLSLSHIQRIDGVVSGELKLIRRKYVGLLLAWISSSSSHHSSTFTMAPQPFRSHDSAYSANSDVTDPPSSQLAHPHVLNSQPAARGNDGTKILLVEWPATTAS